MFHFLAGLHFDIQPKKGDMYDVKNLDFSLYEWFRMLTYTHYLKYIPLYLPAAARMQAPFDQVQTPLHHAAPFPSGHSAHVAAM